MDIAKIYNKLDTIENLLRKMNDDQECYVVTEREWDGHTGLNNKTVSVFWERDAAVCYLRDRAAKGKNMVIVDDDYASNPHLRGCGHTIKLYEAYHH